MRGFWPLKSARIFPRSPTNIIPSFGISLLSTSNSSGVDGLIPPSYQMMSKGGLSPRGANLYRSVQAVGKEKSFFCLTLTWSTSVQVWVNVGSILIGEPKLKTVNTDQRL